MTFRRGRQCTNTSASGRARASGSKSMRPFVLKSAELKGVDSQCSYHRQPVGQDDGKRGPRGFDAGKKVMGRKRHIVVDTIGMLLAIVVHPADIQDRDGARLVMDKLKGRFPRLRLIWADAGYAGQLVDWIQASAGYTLQVVRRPRGSHQFAVLPRRWVVERTLAWVGRCRRLSKDYEALPETSEAWVHVAMVHLMLRRLAARPRII